MSRSGNLSYLLVYLLALLASAVPILILVTPKSTDRAILELALRLTAWLGVLAYLVVFTARPLRQLVPVSLTLSLLRNRPHIGLCFAAIMTVHLGLIAWVFVFVLGERPPLLTLLVGGTAYTLLFLMVITTFDAPARALGPRYWRYVHKTGLYYIGAVFAVTLTPLVLANPADPVYLTIGILMILAIGLRVSAYLLRKYQSTAAIDSAR